VSDNYHWRATDKNVDMSMAPPQPRPVTIPAEWQSVTVDLNRTAMIVIDMQNDFCTEGGWVDAIGGEFRCDRAPIAPLRRLLPGLRAAGVPVIWVNWGNRPDLLNMPPNQIHLYKPHGGGIGLGDPLPKNGAAVLQKDSWAAAVVDELAPEPGDVRVDKHRISGFWDTSRQHPAQSGRDQPVVCGGKHRSVRDVHLAGRQLPGLWMRAGRGLLRDVFPKVLH
jgi:nicotinamidase-related amidase